MNWYKNMKMAAVTIDPVTKKEVIVDDNSIDRDVERQFGQDAFSPQTPRVEQQPAYTGPRLTVDNLFYDYIIPVSKKLYPNFPIEHYSLKTFLNMSRRETGLDNRRRDNDPAFVQAGTEIKELTDKCLRNYGGPKFDGSVRRLVDRLNQWYFDESPSGKVVERPNNRQIDYKKLQQLGIIIPPNMGAMLSRVAQPSKRLQQMRDTFMKAYNEMEQGDTRPILQWWETYRLR